MKKAPSPIILVSPTALHEELLRGLGVECTRTPPSIHPIPTKGESPLAYVQRAAETRARDAAQDVGHLPVLATHTIVAVGTRIFQGVNSPQEAAEVIALLSGRRHRVYTALTLFHQGGPRVLRTRIAQAHVNLKRLTLQERDEFLDAKEWGTTMVYNPQGIIRRFVCAFRGLPETVLGMPLYTAHGLLTSAQP